MAVLKFQIKYQLASMATLDELNAHLGSRLLRDIRELMAVRA
jgi:hypothetical protein